MKKILCIIILSFMLSTSIASAFVPLAIPAAMQVAGAIITVAGGAAGIYYAMTSGGTTSVSAAGVMSRSGSAAWVDLLAVTPVVMLRNITATFPWTAVKQYAQANQGLYPLLNTATDDIYATPTYPMANGTIAYPNGGTVFQAVQISYFQSFDGNAGYTWAPNPQGMSASSQLTINGIAMGTHLLRVGTVKNAAGTAYIQWARYACVNTTSPVPTVPMTVEQYVKNVSFDGTSAGGAVKTNLQTELDSILNQPSVGASIIDTATDLPFVPPSSPPNNPASPEKVAIYNATGQAGSSSVTYVTAVGAAVNAGNAAVIAAQAQQSVADAQLTAAQAAQVAATAALAANPTSTTLIQNLSAANNTVAAAALAASGANTLVGTSQATAAQIAATAAAAAAAADADLVKSLPGTPAVADDRKAFSFASATALKGALASTWPFNLIGSVTGYYSALVATPTPPIFSFPLPLGFVIPIDLTPWDGIATICRWLVSILMTIGCIYYVVNFWRGVS